MIVRLSQTENKKTRSLLKIKLRIKKKRKITLAIKVRKKERTIELSICKFIFRLEPLKKSAPQTIMEVGIE